MGVWTALQMEYFIYHQSFYLSDWSEDVIATVDSRYTNILNLSDPAEPALYLGPSQREKTALKFKGPLPQQLTYKVGFFCQRHLSEFLFRVQSSRTKMIGLFVHTLPNLRKLCRAAIFIKRVRCLLGRLLLTSIWTLFGTSAK